MLCTLGDIWHNRYTKICSTAICYYLSTRYSIVPRRTSVTGVEKSTRSRRRRVTPMLLRNRLGNSRARHDDQRARVLIVSNNFEGVNTLSVHDSLLFIVIQQQWKNRCKSRVGPSGRLAHPVGRVGKTGMLVKRHGPRLSIVIKKPCP